MYQYPIIHYTMWVLWLAYVARGIQPHTLDSIMISATFQGLCSSPTCIVLHVYYGSSKVCRYFRVYNFFTLPSLKTLILEITLAQYQHKYYTNYFELPLDNFLFTVSTTINPPLATCMWPTLTTYILANNTSTIEGAAVTYVCPGNHEKTAICTETGKWEPNSSNVCGWEATKPSGIQSLCQLVHRFIIISHDNRRFKSRWKDCRGFFGNCVCCGINIISFLCGNIYQKEQLRQFLLLDRLRSPTMMMWCYSTVTVYWIWSIAELELFCLRHRQSVFCFLIAFLISLLIQGMLPNFLVLGLKYPWCVRSNVSMYTNTDWDHFHSADSPIWQIPITI